VVVRLGGIDFNWALHQKSRASECFGGRKFAARNNKPAMLCERKECRTAISGDILEGVKGG
jgi:hypothetical protein